MRGRKEYPPEWDNEPDENYAEELAYLEWVDAQINAQVEAWKVDMDSYDEDFEEYDEITCEICDSRSHREWQHENG